MGNTVTWPIIRLVQRLSMILTLGCCLYLIAFLLFKGHDDPATTESKALSLKNLDLISTAPALDLKPYDASAGPQARDIFSLSGVGPSGAVENTPKGQLPAHLKIVAIVVADPSQIVIEDTFAKKTFFIDKDHPQDGIKMVSVDNKQMTVNYQEGDIIIPISKN